MADMGQPPKLFLLVVAEVAGTLVGQLSSIMIYADKCAFVSQRLKLKKYRIKIF